MHVTSRVDYCNSVLAGAPKALTDKLQRMFSAATRVISDTGKYDRAFSQLLHEKLHWLDVRDRVMFKLVVIVHRCLNGRAPQYLSQRHLHSAERNLLHVPRFRLNTCGCRAFAIASPFAWNSLFDPVRNPNATKAAFRRLLYIFVRTVLAHLAP